MKKLNTFKRVLAGVLAMLTVAAYMPANVGGFLTGSTEIVAKAYDKCTVEGTTLHLVGDINTGENTINNALTNANKQKSEITAIVAEAGTVLPADCSYLFSDNNNYYTSVTTIDLSKADTSSVTDMRSMFDGCSALTSL